MMDLIYVVTTVAFFALMIGYVAACARLGRTTEVTEINHDTR